MRDRWRGTFIAANCGASLYDICFSTYVSGFGDTGSADLIVLGAGRFLYENACVRRYPVSLIILLMIRIYQSVFHN